MEGLVRAKTEGPEMLGRHPETGEPIYVQNGRFGPYVQLGEATEENPKPKRASLPKGMKPEQATVELAARLLSLPRMLGRHPETGQEVQANVGRFGPYVVHEGDFRSIPKGEDVHTIALERALEILAQPKNAKRTAAQPLRELGGHPADGAPVLIFEGRYGPYVKHGEVNASLPRGVEVDEVSLEQAVELLKDRAAAGKKPARGGARKTTGAAAKKSAAKTGVAKTVAKKTPAKKTAAKKTTRRPAKKP